MRILVNGACGKMGTEVVKTVINETGNQLVAACDQINIGKDIVKLLALSGPAVSIRSDLEQSIKMAKPEVIIDFTNPVSVMNNIKTGLTNRVHMIVGTTGITSVDLTTIENLTNQYGVNALIVPNFALGAVLMMRFAAEAARYFPQVEIVELHHNQKMDSPSGTALKTAELINRYRSELKNEEDFVEIEKLSGSRGGDADGIRVHSIRLPGLVAHQEVIFGADGQSLTIRHDSYNRRSFMPGVKLALQKITEIKGLVYGLERILA